MIIKNQQSNQFMQISHFGLREWILILAAIVILVIIIRLVRRKR